MNKPTMSSVCLALINSGGVWSATQLHEKCIEAGIECAEAQVFANMTVYASQKRIARGTEKRTYRATVKEMGKRVIAEDQEALAIVGKSDSLPKKTRTKVVKDDGNRVSDGGSVGDTGASGTVNVGVGVSRPSKVKVKGTKGPDPVAVIAEMQEILGDPYATRLTGSPYTILLLPEYNYTAKSVIARLTQVLGGPFKWLWYQNGNGYIVGGTSEQS